MAKKRDDQFTAAELSESAALINPAPNAPEPDEFYGMGGSYTVDPATGKRTRVAHTRDVPVTIDPTTNARIPRDPEA